MKKIFLLFLLSALLTSCSDNGSSNSEFQGENRNDTTVTVDGVTVRRSADGETDIIQDPDNNATVTEQDDGTFLIESDRGVSQVGVSESGSITNRFISDP